MILTVALQGDERRCSNRVVLLHLPSICRPTHPHRLFEQTLSIRTSYQSVQYPDNMILRLFRTASIANIFCSCLGRPCHQYQVVSGGSVQFIAIACIKVMHTASWTPANTCTIYETNILRCVFFYLCHRDSMFFFFSFLLYLLHLLRFISRCFPEREKHAVTITIPDVI